MLLSQQDPRWAAIQLGASPYSLGPSGCFVTEIADILNITPDVVNQRLNAINGYDADGNDYLDLVNWSKISQAFPGIIATYKTPYNNDDVLAQLAAGNSVLVEVPAAPIGGTGIHCVRYIGKEQLDDPWTGRVRPTSDFPNPISYVVFTGTWTQPVPTPAAPTTTPPSAQPSPLATSFGNAINKSKNFDTVANFVGIPADQAVQLTAGQQVVAYIQNIQADNEKLAKQVKILVAAQTPATPVVPATPIQGTESPVPSTPAVPTTPKQNLATVKIAQKVVPPSATFKNGASPVATPAPATPAFTVVTNKGAVGFKEFFSALFRTLFS